MRRRPALASTGSSRASVNQVGAGAGGVGLTRDSEIRVVRASVLDSKATQAAVSEVVKELKRVRDSEVTGKKARGVTNHT